MKKDDFVVDKGPTPFRLMCDEREISYKDISLASGVAYHNLAKYATSMVKPNEETLAKLNEVCEPIFGKTLTLEDFGFLSSGAEVATGTNVETQNLASRPEQEPASAPSKKMKRKTTTRKKSGRKKKNLTGKTKKAEEDATVSVVETQNLASPNVSEPDLPPVNDIRHAMMKIECADNGFLIRDDVGNCWVVDGSPEDLGKEIGREIYGELDEAEKEIMDTDDFRFGRTRIWGWSVKVAIKAITDTKELHEFNNREI